MRKSYIYFFSILDFKVLTLYMDTLIYSNGSIYRVLTERKSIIYIYIVEMIYIAFRVLEIRTRHVVSPNKHISSKAKHFKILAGNLWQWQRRLLSRVGTSFKLGMPRFSWLLKSVLRAVYTKILTSLSTTFLFISFGKN